MKPKVYITRVLHQEMVDIIKSKTEARMNSEEGIPSKETLLKEVADVDAIICALGDNIDDEAMQTNRNLKVIHVFTSTQRPEDYKDSGMDFEVANRLGLCITNSPVMAEPIGDFTFALMLALARRLVESDRFVREGKWYQLFKGARGHAWSYALHVGADVYGKTLGIIGLGRIGRVVARRAKGFNMKILYYDTVRQTALEDTLGIEQRDLDSLLRESDFVTLHTPEITHIIGKRELSLMKKSAFIINTARGNNIDLDALVEVLEKRQIAGAALDVYEGEPIGPDHPLIKMSNVVLSHHMAPWSAETCRKMADGAVENILNALEGKTPPNLVNQPFLHG
jgi:glyoxylate reductase